MVPPLEYTEFITTSRFELLGGWDVCFLTPSFVKSLKAEIITNFFYIIFGNYYGFIVKVGKNENLENFVNF